MVKNITRIIRGQLLMLVAALLVATGCVQSVGQTDGSSIATNPPSAVVVLPTVTSQVPTPTKISLPKSWLLSVLFASQAPLGDWSPLYNEACEEASMIMVAKYYQRQPLTKELMNDEILKLIGWEEDNGYPIDLTVQEVVEVLQKYFQLKAKVVRQFDVEFIKTQLQQGRLIIAPAAGRELGNPNFRSPGPLYHMLVIRGYNDKYFITNDPGTRRGEKYEYKYQQLLSAIHDWHNGQVDSGDQAIVVISGRE